MKVSRLRIPGGVAGTDATVRVMRRMIDQGKKDVGLRKIAENIVKASGVPAYNYVAELQALHGWVQNHVRYTKDPVDVEYIQTPQETLNSQVGDCDDFTVLLGSLAESIGHPIAIKVVSRDAGRNYHHVYPVAQVGSRLYGLDASMPFEFGAEVAGIAKSKVFYPNGAHNMSKQVFSGLGVLITTPLTKRPAGGDGATTGTVTITTEEPLTKPIIPAVPGTPTIYLPPPEEYIKFPPAVPYQPPPTEPVIIGPPVPYQPPPTDTVISVEPGGGVTRPTNGGGGGASSGAGTTGQTFTDFAQSSGPLGIPWVVWMLGAVFLLKK